MTEYDSHLDEPKAEGFVRYFSYVTALEDAILDGTDELTGDPNRVIPGIEIPEFIVDRIAAGGPSGMQPTSLIPATLRARADITILVRPRAFGGTGELRAYYFNPEVVPDYERPAR